MDVRGLEEGATGAGAPPGVRHARFLAVAAVLLSAFFLLLIVAEGMPPLLMDDPCLRRTRDRLIVLAATPLIPLVTWYPAAALAHGAPVGPETVWRAWHLDPWLLAGLSTAVWGYARGVRNLWRRAGRGRGVRRWQAACFAAGATALALAVLSPLDALGHALFSAHMVQHLLLMVVAAPLLVVAVPGRVFPWALAPPLRKRLLRAWHGVPGLGRIGRTVAHPGTVLAMHVAAVWFWHLPGPYQAALESRWVHDLEHTAFFGSALLFWWVLARSGARGWFGHGAGVLYVFATLLQSGALGALITFAPRPWYPAHAPGAAEWGVDLLMDQRLAGLVMWVPAGLVYVLAAVILVAAWLRAAERRAAARERSAPAHSPKPCTAGETGAPPPDAGHPAPPSAVTRHEVAGRYHGGGDHPTAGDGRSGEGRERARADGRIGRFGGECGRAHEGGGIGRFGCEFGRAHGDGRIGRFGGGLLVALIVPLFGACELGRHEEPPRQVPGGDADRGRRALQAYACGACHTIPGVARANGRVAPPLTHFADRGFIAGVRPNAAEELVRWIMDPQAVNPETAMPDLGVTEGDARDMAAYLYTLR